MGSPARAVSFLTDLTSWHADTFRSDSTGDFDTTALHGLRITSSTSGRMVCDFPVDKRVQNRFGTLHGGCIGNQSFLHYSQGCELVHVRIVARGPVLTLIIWFAATLVDDVSSGAIVSVAPHAGVSVHMSMNYLSPTPGGQDCEVDAHVTKAGRTLAFADVEIRNKRTGKVTARGTHIKFIPPMPDPTASSSNIKMPPGAPKAAATPEAAEDFITDMINDVREGFQADATRNFEATALCGLRDITATRGQVVCVLPVNQRVQNRYNTLHGGCIGRHAQQHLSVVFFAYGHCYAFCCRALTKRASLWGKGHMLNLQCTCTQLAHRCFENTAAVCCCCCCYCCCCCCCRCCTNAMHSGLQLRWWMSLGLQLS